MNKRPDRLPLRLRRQAAKKAQLRRLRRLSTSDSLTLVIEQAETCRLHLANAAFMEAKDPDRECNRERENFEHTLKFLKELVNAMPDRWRA